MTRTLRLHLIITIAGFMPAMSIVWHRIDERAERAADAELAVALAALHDPSQRSPDACNAWLRAHSSHPLADQVRRIVQPDLIGQLTGVRHRGEALAGMLGADTRAK